MVSFKCQAYRKERHFRAIRMYFFRINYMIDGQRSMQNELYYYEPIILDQQKNASIFFFTPRKFPSMVASKKYGVCLNASHQKPWISNRNDITNSHHYLPVYIHEFFLQTDQQKKSNMLRCRRSGNRAPP